MLLAAVQQVAVDLVRADRHPMPQADFGHAFQLGAAEYPPHRVVRVTQQEETSLVGNGRFKGLKIHLILSIGAVQQLTLLARHAGIHGGEQKRRVNRRLDQHTPLRSSQSMADQVEAGHHARQEQQVVGRNLPAVQAQHALDQHLAQLGQLTGQPKHRRVAKNAVRCPLLQRLDDRLR